MSVIKYRYSAAVALAAALVLGCTGTAPSSRYSRDKAQQSLVHLEEPGLVIGVMTLARQPVIDGDTIKIDGLDTTLRLLAIDTEETFKNEADRRAAEADFQGYLSADRQGGRPPKVATPLGEEAKAFAKTFFADVRQVRLERDHPKEIRGRFNRYLSYVLVNKNGSWLNYNIECVRAGMSPYFTKYGYSRRFHGAFVAAEAEARRAGIGIWDPGKQGYGDYEQRREWWNRRADFIKAFEDEATGRDDYIVLTNWDSLRRLEAYEGKEVTLLGTVGEIRLGDRGPTKVMLSRRIFNDFALVFFDKDVYGSSGIARHKGEFIRVRGRVSTYFNKRRKQSELQIVVNRPGQIVGAGLPDGSAEGSGDGPGEQQPEQSSDAADPSPASTKAQP